MRMILALTATAAVLVGGPAAAAGCDEAFLFRPNDRLSMQEFSSLAADSDTAEAANDLMLVAKVTDWETAATRGDWQLLAVLYAAESGCCSQVTGGTLWVRRREAFETGGGLAFRRARDGLQLTFRPAEPIPGCPGGFMFRLDGRGNLFAQGRRIGQVRSD